MKKKLFIFLALVAIVSTTACSKNEDIDDKKNVGLDNNTSINKNTNISKSNKIVLKDSNSSYEYLFSNGTLEYVNGVTKYKGTFTFKGNKSNEPLYISILCIQPIEKDGHYYNIYVNVNKELQPGESIEISGEIEEEIKDVINVEYQVEH